MIDLTELQTMRDALQRAMFSGTRRVQFADRSIEYNGVEAMQKALGDLDTLIAETSGKPQSSFSLAVHSRD